MPDLFLTSDEMDIECPTLFGISSALKAYKLAWQINSSHSFIIERNEDVTNYNDGGFHTLYSLQEPDSSSELLLVRNKGTKGFYFKKYKHIDFIVFSIAPDIYIDNNCITLFKALEGVSLCTKLDSPLKPDNMNFVQLL